MSQPETQYQVPAEVAEQESEENPNAALVNKFRRRLIEDPYNRERIRAIQEESAQQLREKLHKLRSQRTTEEKRQAGLKAARQKRINSEE
jgi:plasmid maintenance system killer protein